MAGLARVFAGLCSAVVPLMAQQAHVNLDWAPHKNTQGLKPFGASLISTEVHDDRTVTFRVKAPQAQTVELTGGPVRPNLYVYKLVNRWRCCRGPG